MNQNLNERVLDLVKSTNVNHWDHRSAVGMARTWLEKHKPIVRADPFFHLDRRDDLAEALIAEIQSADKVDAVAALDEARDWINLPFLDLSMNGQLGKANLEKPGGRE